MVSLFYQSVAKFTSNVTSLAINVGTASITVCRGRMGCQGSIYWGEGKKLPPPPNHRAFPPKDFEYCHSTNLKIPRNLPSFPQKMNLHSRFLPQMNFLDRTLDVQMLPPLS